MARLRSVFIMMAAVWLATGWSTAMAADDNAATPAGQTPIPSVAATPAEDAQTKQLTDAVRDCLSEVNAAFDAGEKERGVKLQSFQESLKPYCEKHEYQTVQTLTQFFMQENYRKPRFALMDACVTKKGATLPDSMRPDAGAQPEMYGSAICDRLPATKTTAAEEGDAQ